MKTTDPVLLEAREQARKALRSLAPAGATADEVAVALTKRGIKGSRQLGFACPVAHLIRGDLDQKLFVMVNRATVEIALSWESKESVMLRLPAGVAAFIAGFDKGEYPTLIG